MAEDLSLNSPVWHLWILHYLFIKYLLSLYFVPGFLLSTGLQWGNKTDKVPALIELYSVCKRMRITNKQIDKLITGNATNERLPNFFCKGAESKYLNFGH